MTRAALFNASALLSGTIFGLGLAISGMTSPAKVKAFLDITAIKHGGWDPSLAFVMAAAVIVTMAAVRIAHRQRRPLVAPAFAHPGVGRIDARLLIGAALFGVGWGLAGLCPGPAIADIATSLPDILIFVTAMIVGSMIVQLARRGRANACASEGANDNDRN